MLSFDSLLCLILGLAAGTAVGWLAYRAKYSATRQGAEEEKQVLEKNATALRIELARVAERNRILEDNAQTLQTELAQERQFNISLHAELSRERTSRSHLEQKLDQQKADLQQFQQKLGQDFRKLVEQALAEKSQTLNDLNRESLHLLLQPLSEEIQGFKQKIEEQHSRETRELIVLHNKLANLESNRSRPPSGSNGANGASTTPTAIATSGNAALAVADEEAQEEAAAETTQVVLPLPSKLVLAQSPEAANHQTDTDGFQGFTPKQEVEIDNFLKRTLGRVQRKKPSD